MANIRYGKWGCWIQPVGVLLSLFALITAQQPGFLSIRCGGKTNYTDENDITWVTDANYIDVGETADIGNVNALGSPLDSLRFFPKPLKKSCYTFPVPSNVPYLLRLWFLIGNYSGFQTLPSFAYSFETADMLAMLDITLTDNGIYDERIMATSGIVMYVCLIRTSESDDPFISGIELRPLRDGMYAQAKPGTMLASITRIDVGGNSLSLRYPQDKFDRIWRSDISIDSSNVNLFRSVSTEELVSINNTEDFPPTSVMQTAWVVNSSETAWVVNSSDSDAVNFTLGLSQGRKSLLLLYFAEIETLNITASRSFYVMTNGGLVSEIVTLAPNYSTVELQFVSNQSDNFNSNQPDTFQLWQTSISTLPPIINAYEYYRLIHTQPATSSQDIEALDAMKRSFDIKDWISDPCYLIMWKGIRCANRSSGIRISEIDLSGRNLTGSVPNDIEKLTALVNVSLANNYLSGSLPNFSNSTMLQTLYLQNNNLNGIVPEWLSELKNLTELSLDNNHFSGSLPNFSHLTMLQRLYLQNNNLNGIVPEWLSELKNLKELNIENNNFSGVIPAQLLHNCLLNLSYSGNPYLRISKRECTPQNSMRSNHNKLNVVLGLTLSGFLISALVLIAGIVMYGNKKKECVTTENVVEMTADSTIIVPNPTKPRVFSVEEMAAATQKFRGIIGKGGFGSVFFGKLPEGNDIAVKVLSLFNDQGVQQFLNEIDVLSKVHHENLVSLLGHCNESKELMIIYEHMSGGSLRDRLYDEGSELNWKTRLKIALDAAQGLEYMHVVCTPKIIHRDVKTANILLDSNLNGKLGDFGLSRVWINGEASHVTTMVKGTAGYLDPEYFSTERLTDKSDVYSFGVVLLEIICGRKPIDAKLPIDELNIIRWATPLVEMDAIPGKIEEIVDKRLSGNYDLKSITRVAKVAIRCVKAEPFYRPSVSEIVAELTEAMKLEEICKPAGSIS